MIQVTSVECQVTGKEGQWSYPSPSPPVTRHSSGFTLMELIVTLGVFVVLMSLVTELTLVSLRVSQSLRLQTAVQQAAGQVHERLRRDLYGALRVALQPDRLWIKREDGSPVEYRWEAKEQKLYRIAALESETEPGSSRPHSMTPPDIRVAECQFARAAGDSSEKQSNLLKTSLFYSHPGPGGTPPITFRHEVILRASF